MNRNVEPKRGSRLPIACLAIIAILPAAFASAQPVCDHAESAKAVFQQLAEQRKLSRSSESDTTFRDSAETYMRLAEACYEARYGVDDETRIDDDGAWAPGSAPTSEAEFRTFGTKWGVNSPFPGGQDVPGPATPGGLVTYSFMADGVSSAGEAPDANTAVTSLATFQPCFLTEIDLMFDAWEAISDIQFTEVADNGVPYDTAGAVGDIRIGAHTFDESGGVLAHAYFPPPNGVSLAGDLHFDFAENWQCSPGAGFDFGIVTLHEIGHSIGLHHEPSPPAGNTAVMNSFYNAAITGLLPDDIAGAESIYGSGTFDCTLDMNVSIGGGTVNLGIDLGATQATTWSFWVVAFDIAVPVFSVPIPAINPPVNLVFPFAISGIGTMGVLSTLSIPADGIVCSDFVELDTTP